MISTAKPIMERGKFSSALISIGTKRKGIGRF